MPVTAQFVDTNILLRFFSGEPPEQAMKARRLIERADAGELLLIIVPLVLAETFYTLESYYKIDRRLVAEKLEKFLHCRGIETFEKTRLLDALTRCRNKRVHLTDAYLAACAAEMSQPIASFDRDFEKFADVKRIEPS